MHPVEPRLEDHLPVDERKAKRFLSLLVSFIVVALVLLGAFNWLVDPLAMYGSPLELNRLEPVRLAKLELLRDADPPPAALVIGSSRVRLLAPVGVKQLFGTETFHLGGPKSTPQYWLTLTRHAVDDLGYPIRLVILGVDPSSFVDVTNYMRHPADVPELRRHLRHPIYSRFRSLVHVWSPQQTRASLVVLKASGWSLGSAGERPPRWDRRGFVRRLDVLDPDEIARTVIRLHRSSGAVEREHLDDFEAFLDFAEARDIRIVAYVTPEAPSLTRALAATHYPQTLEATRTILIGASSRGLVLCEISSLGLTESDFVDPHHPTLHASTRILGTLQSCAGGKGGD
jgi:hypothetical protein